MMNRDRLTLLSEMKNYQVSEEDPDVRGWHVVGAAGEVVGTVRDLLIDPSRMKAEYLAVSDGKGRDVLIPAASATLNNRQREVVVSGNGDWESSRTETRDAYGSTATGRDEARLTRAEEELRVGTRQVEAGEVVVAKHVETERVTQEVPIERERVRVERRPVSEMRGAADIGADEIRIPVVEEELVVEKRPVVKEELVISKERITDTERVDTEVRKEEFDISGDTEFVHSEADARRRRE